MTEVISDIIEAWAADGTMNDIAGPFLGRAPDASAYPYAVYTVNGSGGDEYHFNRVLIEKPVVRITLYHTTASSLWTYFRAMEDFLLQQEFGSALGSTSTRFFRISKGPGSPIFSALPDLDSAGNTVYFAAGVYTIAHQRTLPA